MRTQIRARLSANIEPLLAKPRPAAILPNLESVDRFLTRETDVLLPYVVAQRMATGRIGDLTEEEYTRASTHRSRTHVAASLQALRAKAVSGKHIPRSDAATDLVDLFEPDMREIECADEGLSSESPTTTMRRIQRLNRWVERHRN